MSLTSFPDLIDGLNADIAKLRAGASESMRGFSALAREALKPGALDVKSKELIAIGIAIATRCDGCVGFHVKAAFEGGGHTRGGAGNLVDGDLHGRWPVDDLCCRSTACL